MTTDAKTRIAKDREADEPKDDVSVGVFRDKYDMTVECPWCGSTDNTVVNPFGGTVSEIAFECGSCGNPFGWMKW
jgi:transcription elongation factor Elf1